MPYKDKSKHAEYMREYRAAKKVYVNPRKPINPKRKPSKPNQNEKKVSDTERFYEDGYWNGVNGVNPDRKPINPPVIQKYLLSYSRKKYQFVLYQVDEKCRRNLVKSYPKGSKLSFPGIEIELTWGPEDIIKEELP